MAQQKAKRVGALVLECVPQWKASLRKSPVVPGCVIGGFLALSELFKRIRNSRVENVAEGSIDFRMATWPHQHQTPAARVSRVLWLTEKSAMADFIRKFR